VNVSDLVNFHTSSWVFDHAKQRYQNPGVILKAEPPIQQHTPRYQVFWSDGKITWEHGCYLRPATKEEQKENG